MINIVGVVIAASGFFAPYLTDGRIPSTALFWIGGLVFLNKGVLIQREATWTKWARIGIWTNIALFLIMLATFYLTIGKSMTTIGHWFSMLPYWFARPATALGQQIFPIPATPHPDGSVSFHMGFARSVTTDFLDVGLFAMFSAVIGLYWTKRLQKKES